MSSDGMAGLIGAFGLLAIVFLGYTLIFRGILTGLPGSPVPLTSPLGFGQGVFGRTLASLLSFAVAYKFFFERYAERLLAYEAMLGMAVVGLAAMTLVPALETLVAVAALTLFLIENTAVFGQAAIGTFFGLLFLYTLLRWLLGR